MWDDLSARFWAWRKVDASLKALDILRLLSGASLRLRSPHTDHLRDRAERPLRAVVSGDRGAVTMASYQALQRRQTNGHEGH